ncbi:uncharacterized protein LOC132756566 isoform X2 [Ruditapes philippinarum]|uniref:uncharacterized protein LOC132756566 isoform X2 n=1 Tax=Ruditapes philippinarum TaxID=129788 RepID=UPI00295B4AA8|nr:uncharacterized protein LOC132756566 isoform X2 [Ruditapes philippinarum]
MVKNGFFLVFVIINSAIYVCSGNLTNYDSENEKENKVFGNALNDEKNNYARKFVRKRSANGTDIYGHLAGISGGSVIHVDKDNISKAVDVLSTVTLTNPVIVKRRQLKINGVGQIPFYVDNSLTKIALEIKTSCCKPDKVIVTDPTGSNLTTTSVNVTVKVDTTTMTYVMISRKFVPGSWILSIYDTHNQNYDVTIHGSSLIDFDLSMCDSLGNTVPGQPIPGSNSTYVKVSPIGLDLVSNWTSLQMFAVNGTLIQTTPVGRLRGSRTSKAFLIPVVWPKKDVYVGVIGKDKDGNIFTREQDTLVQPIGIRIILNNSESESIHSCYSPLFIPFTIKNTGATGDFQLQAETDNSNFLAKISPSTIKINSHATVSGHCDVTLTATPGSALATQVIISVLDSTSKFQYVAKTIFASGVVCSHPVTSSIVITSVTNRTQLNLTITTTSGTTALRTDVNNALFLVTVMAAFVSCFTNKISV